MSFVPPPGGGRRGRLLTLFDRLPAGGQDTLLAFAEFLATRVPAAQQPRSGPPPSPAPASRPAEESVVAAIRRLSAGYPMLDRRRLLDITSGLMTQHILHGRGAVEVIDDLERAFTELYAELVRAWGSSEPGDEEPPEQF